MGQVLRGYWSTRHAAPDTRAGQSSSLVSFVKTEFKVNFVNHYSGTVPMFPDGPDGAGLPACGQ